MNRRLAFAVLLLGGALLTALWQIAPGTPPIYDGICQASPYHTLGASPAPLAASKNYPAAAAGAFPTSEVISDPSTQVESPSQVQILMTDGTFVSSEPFTISVTPVAPPGPHPGDGNIDGNVYRIAATTQSGKQLQPVDAQHQVTVLLRATAMNPARTLERLDGNAWTGLRTLFAGCGDLFEANTDRLGYFANVVPASSGGGGNTGGGPPVVPIVIALVAVVLVTIIGLIRINRSRAR